MTGQQTVPVRSLGPAPAPRRVVAPCLSLTSLSGGVELSMQRDFGAIPPMCALVNPIGTCLNIDTEEKGASDVHG